MGVRWLRGSSTRFRFSIAAVASFWSIDGCSSLSRISSSSTLLHLLVWGRRSELTKDVDLLVLRHQLAVLVDSSRARVFGRPSAPFSPHCAESFPDASARA